MSERGDPGFTFAGVLLLAAIGAFAWRSAPLESVRPPTDSAKQPEILLEGQVPARLWQDPLKALQHYQPDLDIQAAKQRKGLREEIKELVEQANSTRLTVLSVMVTPGAYSELEERRRRRRYAALAGLGDSGFVPQDAEALGVLSIGLQYQTAQAFAFRSKEAPPTVQDTFLIPYEWYEFEDPKTGYQQRRDPETEEELREKVLLLWLDESRFTDQPFSQLHKVVSAVLPVDLDLKNGNSRKPRIDWKVIGPARSGTLRHFVADQCSGDVKALRNDVPLRHFDILSPVATVSDTDLLKHQPKLPCDWQKGDSSDSLTLFSAFGASCKDDNRTCLRFLRTIRSDDVLIAELKRELVRRGIKDDDDVVILSEWDTYFGRFLPRAFDASKSGIDPGSEVAALPQLNSWHYTYARGIDGITVGITPKPLLKTETDQADLVNILSPTQTLAVRRPEGTGQFDYLRRLADRISARDRQLRLEKGRGVRAVAILGSDVYDKLLILRALRHRLPGAIWVTTDLDTQFLHPGDLVWTRNLVVAATFGLTLPHDIQPSSPPFRDSYQTAVYLATRMAVDLDSIKTVNAWQKNDIADMSTAESYPNQEQMNEAIPPRLFEIGRHGVVPLYTEEETHRSALNATREATWKSHTLAYFIGGGLISVLALLALHQLRPRSGRPVLSIGALILAAGILAVIAVLQRATGEPISLSDGVSIWPTEFIRLVAVFLAISFLWTAIQRLQNNARLLDSRYFCAGKPKEDIGLTLQKAKDRLLDSVQNMVLPAWLAGTFLLIIFLMVSMYYIGIWQWWLHWKLLALGIGWALVIVLWLLFVNGKILASVHVRSINQWLAQESEEQEQTQESEEQEQTEESEEQEQTAGELWTVYREYGVLKHRVLRSMTYVLFYVAFGTLVFSLLGAAAAPCRGTIACKVDGILLGFGVLLMLFLLFFVVDATRLCIYWIEKLQSPRLNWDDTSRNELAKQMGLPVSHATYYLQIHLIGERTTEVGRLLYYPVVIILLMLLARTTYFDDWGFPQALAVVVGTNFLIAVIAAARLNAAAKQARDSILEKLRRESLELRASEAQQPAVATPDEVKELISQLSQFRIGAFQHLWDQPLVRGSLLILSGIGITYVEYLPLP